MNKRIIALFLAISILSLGQDAFSLTFQAYASIEIVKEPGGIKPSASKGFDIAKGGSGNNAQVSYLDKRENGIKQIKYASLQGDKHVPQNTRLSVQYE